MRYLQTLERQLKLIAHFTLGCYTALFAVSIYLTFYGPRRESGVNKHILIISGLLYLSCSTHFALVFSDFYRVMVCASHHIETTQSSTPPQVANDTANQNILVVSDLLISVTDFIGELILIYRCWLLWSRNYWVIILPSLLSIASIGESLMTMAASWCSPTTFWCHWQYVLV